MGWRAWVLVVSARALVLVEAWASVLASEQVALLVGSPPVEAIGCAP